MNELVKKIGLGTVQFGLDYGISNAIGKTAATEVQQILDFAWSVGIRTLDTARVYGESEVVIGNQEKKKFDIVTKFPASVSTKHDLMTCFSQSLDALQIGNVYGYLAHSAENLLENPFLWECLLEIREQGKVRKIGCSVYSPIQLEQIFAAGIVPDLVQLPFNFLDRRFLPYLEELRRLGVEIHARSAFLQGIFFIDLQTLDSFFEPIKPILLELQALFHSKEELAAQLLAFVAEQNAIDKVIIGVNTLSQLQENFQALSLYSTSTLPDKGDCVLSDQLLIPNYWPQKLNT